MPNISQRITITIATVLGALIWLTALGAMQAADGSKGVSLFDVGSGWPAAMMVLVAAGLPAVAMGVAQAAVGDAISGVFVIAAALAVLAAGGGPIDGFLRRSELPGDYLGLLVELVLWLVAWTAVLLLIERLRNPIRKMLPTAWVGEPSSDSSLSLTRWRRTDAKSILAGLLCAAVGAVVGLILIRSSDSGQVIFGLVIAFTLGGLAAQTALGPMNPAPILMSPILVGAGTYVWALMEYESRQQMLGAWYAQRLPGLALALPIHYVSAGVVGCVLGILWAHTLLATKATAS